MLPLVLGLVVTALIFLGDVLSRPNPGGLSRAKMSAMRRKK